MEYKSNNNIVYSCNYVVVFCTKYRRKVLVGGVAERLKTLIPEICGSLDIELLEMKINPEYVHLLLDVDPQLGIHKAVKQIKGRTSHVLRDEYRQLTTKIPSLWTNSYFVSTVGSVPADVFMRYIESQKTSQRQ